MLDRYKRRSARIEQIILRWVAAGMSTRQVSRELGVAFDGILSAGGVSRVVAKLDQQIAAFHTRSLLAGYRFVYFDAKHGWVSRLRNTRGRGKKTEGTRH